MHHKIPPAITTAVVDRLPGFTSAPTVAQETDEDSLMALPQPSMPTSAVSTSRPLSA